MHHDHLAWTCCSGTFAVELALRSLKVEAGDEVILAAYDFSGNFKAVEAIGARPVLIDIRPDNWCIDSELVAAAISNRTKAIIVSHLHGGLADVERIRQIAAEHGLRVVEDACQAPGAMTAGQAVGTLGDVGVLSFGGSKLLTAGRGGAILTRDSSVLQRAKIYCEQGNNAYPMSELQAAVLIPQIELLPQYNELRLANVTRLLHRLEAFTCMRGLKLNVTQTVPAFYKVPWLFSNQADGVSVNQFIQAMQAEGVALDRGFRGFAKRSNRRCRVATDLTHASQAANSTILLHHPILLQGTTAIDKVVEAFRKVIDRLGII